MVLGVRPQPRMQKILGITSAVLTQYHFIHLSTTNKATFQELRHNQMEITVTQLFCNVSFICAT